MTTPLSTLGRAALVLLALAGGMAAARVPRDRVPGSTPGIDPVDAGGAPPAAAWAAEPLVGRDPFREDRKPTSPRYRSFDADLEPGEGEAREPSVPRPEWTLTGVLWGPQPLVLFDGVDRELSSGVLAQGDTVGPFVVERIAPDTVYIRGPGASWAFTIETPWKAGGNP